MVSGCKHASNWRCLWGGECESVRVSGGELGLAWLLFSGGDFGNKSLNAW